MPTYEIEDQFGRVYEVEGDTPPSDAEIDELIGSLGMQELTTPPPPRTFQDPNAIAASRADNRQAMLSVSGKPEQPVDVVDRAKTTLADTLALGGTRLQQGFHDLGEQGNSLMQLGSEPFMKLGPLAMTLSGLRLSGPTEDQARFFREGALGARERAAALEPQAQELEKAGIPLTGDVTRGAMSLLPAVAAGPLGVPGVVAAAGAQQGASTLSRAQDAYEKRGFETAKDSPFMPNRAFWKSAAPAAIDAAQTAAITFVAGKLFGPGAEGLTLPAKRAAVKDVVKQSLGEAVEEGTQQLISDAVIAKLSYNPEMTFAEALDGAKKAALVGGILGGGVTLGRAGLDSLLESEAEKAEMDRAITQSADEIALQGTFPQNAQMTLAEPQALPVAPEEMVRGDQPQRVEIPIEPSPEAKAVTPLPTEREAAAVPPAAEAPLGDIKTPPLPTGERLVTVERPDGTTYPASFGDKYYDMTAYGGTKHASIGKLVGGKWSHGVLAPGEKIIELKSGAIAAGPTPEAQPDAEVGPGMGAAKPMEFQPPAPFKTSNKNETVDAERKARGLPPMMSTARQSNQAAWDEAMDSVDEHPAKQDELIAELTEKPRAVTPTENALLLHRRIDLRNEYEKALYRWKQAFEDDDYVRAAEESQRVKDWSGRLSDLEDITKRTGAESGRSLQARKIMAREDYSLAQMELKAMQAKGRNLTYEEHIQLIRARDRIAELERKLEDLESGKEAREVGIQTEETMREVSKKAKGEATSKDFDIDREEKLLGRIKAKIDKGQQDEITPLVQQLARMFWRRGVRTREPMIEALHGALQTIIPEITVEETRRAFSGYGNYKALSKEEIDVGLRDLRGQTQQVLKMEALEARKPLEKTGVERREPSDEERRLIKQVNELKRRYGVVVTDPATQLKSALAARKTYYEHRIADLKHEIETRQRIVKTKTASPTDPELDAMIAEHERLKTEHEQIFTKPDMTDEQRLKLALAAATRNQAQWESRLENAEKGIFDKRVPGRKVTSPELELIQAETAAMREHVRELEQLSKSKKTPEQIALQSLKTRMKTREADFRRRITEKDFTKRTRKPVPLDAEGLKLKAALDAAKSEFETELEKDRWAKMSVFDKTKRKIADTYDAARALMTTGELSFILRQGKMVALSRPIQTAKALPDMFRALLANEQRAHEIDLQIHNHPDAAAARTAKLHLVEEGVSLHKQEEIMMGRWVGKIPVVKNFNRAAQVFLNRIRFDTWQALRKSLSKSGTPTSEEDRQIAMFVNESTGRGGLGKLEPAAVPLARAMFSPRYYASRLQLAAGHSLWGGTMRSRRIIATEYARSLVGLGLYYSMLIAAFKGGDDDEERGRVELDPRSTDFGKVQVGNTRLDPLAGLSQVIVLASRTATGEKKTTTKREVQPIRGPEVKFGGDKWSDIMARHLRGKLHPVPASIANLFDGTDLGGDEATVVNQAGNLIAPITYLDIYAALKEQDLPDGVALALLALLGEGIQTFEKREKD